MAPRKPTYTPLPKIPAALRPRLTAVLQVLAGSSTVAAAARSLSLSRNHFQSILHRGVQGIVAGITAKKGGRPRTPTVLTSLQLQLVRLQRENAKLSRRVESTEQLLQVAGNLLHGRIRPTRRQRRPRKRAGAHGDRPEEPEPVRRRARLVAEVEQMHDLGVSRAQAAVIAGHHPATLRRWRARTAHAVPPELPSATAARVPSVEVQARAEQLVRQLHGLIGADALRHRIAGLSRRAAAAIKAHTLTVLEHERKTITQRVILSQPGILRGMDQLYVLPRERHYIALICADGAIPFRTSQTGGAHYDAALVARALDRDFDRHGAPLVLRFDRASPHTAPPVRALLAAHDVLVLQGPAHYPRFYGQLERQNREHRGWLATPLTASVRDLEPYLDEMLEALNALWPRKSLGWHTAAELWANRPTLSIDRRALREEVQVRAAKIARTLNPDNHANALAERLAIEQTLEHHGYLRQERGGWC